MDELIFRQPSLLILDHFDDLFPNETTMTDANLILASQKLSLCKTKSIFRREIINCLFFFEAIRELFHRIQDIHKQVIIISLAKQLTNIHRLFTEETPLFASETFVIEPLNAVSHSICMDLNLFSFALVSTNIHPSTID